MFPRGARPVLFNTNLHGVSTPMAWNPRRFHGHSALVMQDLVVRKMGFHGNPSRANICHLPAESPHLSSCEGVRIPQRYDPGNSGGNMSVSALLVAAMLIGGAIPSDLTAQRGGGHGGGDGAGTAHPSLGSGTGFVPGGRFWNRWGPGSNNPNALSACGYWPNRGDHSSSS